MTLAQLMALISVEVAQQKGPEAAQPAEISDWADLTPTAQGDGNGHKDEEQGDAKAAVADATVPGSARLLDDNDRLGRFAHVR